jgi:hypothetical protein
VPHATWQVLSRHSNPAQQSVVPPQDAPGVQSRHMPVSALQSEPNIAEQLKLAGSAAVPSALQTAMMSVSWQKAAPGTQKKHSPVAGLHRVPNIAEQLKDIGSAPVPSALQVAMMSSLWL